MEMLLARKENKNIAFGTIRCNTKESERNNIYFFAIYKIRKYFNVSGIH